MQRTHLLTPAFLALHLGLIACSPASTPSQDTAQAQSPNLAQSPTDTNACTLVEQGSGPAGTVNIRVEEVVTGLQVPWGIDFLPNGEMLVTEREGRVRRVQNGQLQPQPVATLNNVADEGEGGLLGIAVHPDFATNRQFYLYYTARENGKSVNRVERWRLAENGSTATRGEVIVDNIPVARFHNGGRIRFGPDGMLYIGTGDARNPDLSQDRNSLAGKILRVTPEGKVSANNPFPNNPVYITGIRNTQGFDWVDPKTMWVTDHGPSGELGRSGHDKVSRATAGDNLGWPTVERCNSRPGFVTPSIVWRQALPPGGAAIYSGKAIPEWQGSLIIATLRSQHLQRVVFDRESSRKVARHEIYLKGEYGRLREAVMGPDGELYVTTSNCDGRGTCPAQQDKILRITR